MVIKTLKESSKVEIDQVDLSNLTTEDKYDLNYILHNSKDVTIFHTILAGLKDIKRENHHKFERPRKPHEVLEADFLHKRIKNYGKRYILNIADEFNMEMVLLKEYNSKEAKNVVYASKELIKDIGTGFKLKMDNGKEFTANEVVSFLGSNGIEPTFITKGCLYL